MSRKAVKKGSTEVIYLFPLGVLKIEMTPKVAAIYPIANQRCLPNFHAPRSITQSITAPKR